MRQLVLFIFCTITLFVHCNPKPKQPFPEDVLVKHSSSNSFKKIEFHFPDDWLG